MEFPRYQEGTLRPLPCVTTGRSLEPHAGVTRTACVQFRTLIAALNPGTGIILIFSAFAIGAFLDNVVEAIPAQLSMANYR